MTAFLTALLQILSLCFYVQKDLPEWPIFFSHMITSLKVLKDSMIMKFLTLTSTNVQAMSELLFKNSAQALWTVLFMYCTEESRWLLLWWGFVSKMHLLWKRSVCTFSILHYLICACFCIQVIFFFFNFYLTIKELY